MDHVEWFAVEDTFQLKGIGLVVTPHFSIPKGWKATTPWRTEPAIIVRPDGSRLETNMKLLVEHFNMIDPEATMDRVWRIVPTFPDAVKEDVPIGSQVLVSPELKKALLPAE
jgi:hypothetical protein